MNQPPTQHNVERALILGDMHGNLFAWERTVAPAVRHHRPDVVVQVGDFGFGWDADYLGALDEILERVDTTVLWLDGNHENFDQLEAIGAFGAAEPFQTSERTWYLPRGIAWEWAGRRCLAVGGAYSVDKPYRTAHVSWWPQEELTDADILRALRAGKVDVFFAHDSFAGVHVPGLHAAWKQADEFAALSAANRHRLLEIVQFARPELYVHGHYHVSYLTRTPDVQYVVGLNREDEIGSMILLEFPSLKWWRL